jgi:hypothetical protein
MTLPAFLLLAASLLPGCNKVPGGTWLIRPRDSGNVLGKNTGAESDLVKTYGQKNVATGRIELGEGEATTGTILFPGDPLRRLSIVWEDSLHRANPARIILRGSRSLWKLPGDVTLGMSLAELERRNGKPITLSGFGWDYEGVVISWSGGSLDTSLTSDVKVYVVPDQAGRARPEYARVQGDRPFPSTMPEMRALAPRVSQIFVDFEHLPSPGQSIHVAKNEIRESDQARTFFIDQGERFAVILDENAHPQRTLDVKPVGILGRDSSVPDVAPPLYAARFVAEKPGECFVTAAGFVVRIQVRPKAL